MAGKIMVNDRIIEVLQEVREHKIQIPTNKARLQGINADIASDEVRMRSLAAEFPSLETDAERERCRESVKTLGWQLKERRDEKIRITDELNEQLRALPCLQEHLENELWRNVVELGQPQDGESASQLAWQEWANNELADVHHQRRNEANGLLADEPSTAVEARDPSKARKLYAKGLFESTSEDYKRAMTQFENLAEVCEAQQYEYEQRVHSPWHDMSRTQFDLEQLKQKMEVTGWLVEAERAYLEACRLAQEVGLIRHDREQSWYFLEEPDDGAYSVMDFPPIKPAVKQSVEAWRENITSEGVDSPVSGNGDAWEVDSLDFGTGPSAIEGDGWYRTKIGEWRELQKNQRAMLPLIAAAKCDSVEKLSTMSAPRSRWPASLNAMKSLLLSGQEAIARISATLHNHRDGSHPTNSG